MSEPTWPPTKNEVKDEKPISPETAAQLKKEQLERYHEFDYSKQTIANNQDIEKLTREAVEAAELNQAYEIPNKEEDLPVVEDEDIVDWKPAKKVTGFKKAFLTTTMFLAGLLGAKAGTTEKGGNDSGRVSKTERTVSIKKDVDLKSARPVNEISKEYTRISKENKIYGVKTIGGKEGTLKMAKPSDNIEGGEDYDQWLIEQLKSGITVDELIKNKYISADNKDKYEQYYVAPEVDVVVMEGQQETKPDPFSAFAKDGEAIYAPNGHIAAEIFYPVRSSSSLTDGGMVNTQHMNALIRLRNDNGFTEEYVIATPEKLAELLGGSHSFQSNEKIEEIKAQFAANKSAGGDMAVN